MMGTSLSDEMPMPSMLTLIWSSLSLHSEWKPMVTSPMGADRLKSAVVEPAVKPCRGRTSVSEVREPVRPTTWTYESRAALSSVSGLKAIDTWLLAPAACEAEVIVATVNLAAVTIRGISPPAALTMHVAAMGTSPVAEMTMVSRLGPVCVYLGLTRSNEKVVSAPLATVSPGATVTTRVPVPCFQAARELNFLMSARVPVRLMVLSGVSEPMRPAMVIEASLSPVRSNSGLKATVILLVEPGLVVSALIVLVVKVAECLMSRAVLSSKVARLVGSDKTWGLMSKVDVLDVEVMPTEMTGGSWPMRGLVNLNRSDTSVLAARSVMTWSERVFLDEIHMPLLAAQS
mmetsp:Transcript_32883/g.76805  ORF Transcript_32883/g.76805 Transcript_32883/m.76805 type:complete len:345 (-) Transcript_32883:4623-5657(-)